MKRIIKQDGPKSTDRALVVGKLRSPNIDFGDLTEQEAKVVSVSNFHDAEYEYFINHWLISNHFRDSVGGPENAGVGGSIPSLATLISITYR